MYKILEGITKRINQIVEGHLDEIVYAEKYGESSYGDIDETKERKMELDNLDTFKIAIDKFCEDGGYKMPGWSNTSTDKFGLPKMTRMWGQHTYPTNTRFFLNLINGARIELSEGGYMYHLLSQTYGSSPTEIIITTGTIEHRFTHGDIASFTREEKEEGKDV